MGEVYKARDTRLNRLVAIKTSKTEFSKRSTREACALAALNHPNICQLYDLGTLPEGGSYLVMEFIDGSPIAPSIPHARHGQRRRRILKARKEDLGNCWAAGYQQTRELPECMGCDRGYPRAGGEPESAGSFAILFVIGAAAAFAAA